MLASDINGLGQHLKVELDAALVWGLAMGLVTGRTGSS